MALRKPRNPGAFGEGDALDPLAYELAQERAANIGRLYRKARQALDDLLAFDASAPAEDREGTRERLVAVAGEALWYYVVQREVSGLRDTDAVMRELRAPREVQLRMGPRRVRRTGR